MTLLYWRVQSAGPTKGVKEAGQQLNNVGALLFSMQEDQSINQRERGRSTKTMKTQTLTQIIKNAFYNNGRRNTTESSGSLPVTLAFVTRCIKALIA